MKTRLICWKLYTLFNKRWSFDEVFTDHHWAEDF